ncbi:hypothetical protein FOZ62_015180, partial [Perkinsus olseni]
AILAKANEMGHCNIRINQINMGRSTVVFQEAIDSLDADIIAIQEPPKLAQCRRILDTAKGDWVLISAQSPSRTAILVKKSVPYRAVRGLVDSRDWVMIDIPCKGTRYSAIRLISGYCPSDGRITMEQCLAGLSDFIDGHHVILCCDSNAWNNSWGTPPNGGSYQRRRGQVLEEWADGLNLQLLNDPDSPPTFRSHRTASDGSEITSHIDVTLCSERLSRDIGWWKVDWSHR